MNKCLVQHFAVRIIIHKWEKKKTVPSSPRPRMPPYTGVLWRQMRKLKAGLKTNTWCKQDNDQKHSSKSSSERRINDIIKGRNGLIKIEIET